MTDALSLLEDDISELNKENTQEQQDPQSSPEKATEQQAKPQYESEHIGELKASTTSILDEQQNEKLNLADPLPKGLLPKERRNEISDQVDKLDGLTSDKNLKMKREWIIREKNRLDEIEALKDMAREAEKRRRRYLSLRAIAKRSWEDVERYWVWGKKRRLFRRKAMMLQAVVRMLLAKKRLHRRRAVVITQRFVRGIIGRNRIIRIEAQLVPLNVALPFLRGLGVCQSEKVCVGWRARLQQPDVKRGFWYERVKKSCCRPAPRFTSALNWKYVWISVLLAKRLLRCKNTSNGNAHHYLQQEHKWDLTTTTTVISSGASARSHMLVRPGMGEVALRLWQAAPDPMMLFSPEVALSFQQPCWIDDIFRRAYQYPLEEFVLAMVAVGIDPNLCPNGSSLLMRCVKWGCFKAAKQLIETGATIKRQSIEGKLQSPLALAKRWLRWCSNQSTRIRKGVMRLPPGFAQRKEGLARLVEYLSLLTHGKKKEGKTKQKPQKRKPKPKAPLPPSKVPLQVVINDVDRAEASVNFDVDCANRKMVQSVARAQDNANMIEMAYMAKDSMARSTALTSAAFSKIQDSEDNQLVKVRARLKDAQMSLESEQPEWMVPMRAALHWVKNMSHSLRTGWRRNMMKSVHKAFTIIKELHSHEKLKELGLIQRIDILQRQNTLAAQKIKPELEEMLQQFINLERIKNIRYHVLYLKVERLQWQLKQLETDRAAKVSNMVRDAREDRQHFRNLRTTAHTAPALMAPLPHQRDKTSSLDDVRAAVKKLKLTGGPAGRSSRHRYHSVLRECVRMGATKEMLQIYKMMTKRRIGVNEKTFKLMMLVCKNATPKPDVELSIDVLKQMKKSGCKTSVYSYNTVLNICAEAGEWRKAARVFKMMILDGVDANTATFSTVAIAISKGPAQDAAAMYDMMKHSGVPEYICYHAASKAIGPVRDW